jgi:MYXO-CTERM domain-containing protein
LGADVFESQLSDEVRHPEPPEPTDEEKAKLEAQLEILKTPAEKKEAKETWENDRKELAARKALIARNQYILTRLHYRYAAAGMPKDVELGEGAAIQGGIDLPQGEHGAADTSVKPGDKNAFQTRYNGLFDNKKVIKCDQPKPHRWGKAPREYRGLNKVWVAEDLSRRDRKRIDPEKAVMTAVPDLGLSGKGSSAAPEPQAAETLEPEEKKGDCGCRAAGAPIGRGWGALGGLLAAAIFWRRRRTQS